MSDELKLVPCPFCGNQAKVVEMDDYFMAMCECGANYEGPSAEDCAEAWNRRATPSPSTATIAEDELPPLPTAQQYVSVWYSTEVPNASLQNANQQYFTADQMRQYARAALASKPAAREAARQSIDTPEFRKLLGDLVRRASYNISGKASPAALIAHIDTWGGAAPAAGNTAQLEK